MHRRLFLKVVKYKDTGFHDIAWESGSTNLLIIAPVLSSLAFVPMSLDILYCPCRYDLLLILPLTHWGRVTQICVFTLQLCKTDEANLRF